MISLHFYAEGDRLVCSTTTLSPQFSWTLEGGSPKLKTQLEAWIEGYLNHKPISFSVPLPEGTPFQKAVWSELINIPFGKTVTYGEVAERIGHPRAARAVGSACGRNPLLILIPCHRVVQSCGASGGFAYNPLIKKRLLAFESSEK